MVIVMKRASRGAIGMTTLLALVFLLLPSGSVYAEHCENIQSSTIGSLFQAYEEAEYSSDGWLIIRLKINPVFNEGQGWNFSANIFNDECTGATRKQYKSTMSIPADVAFWSIRFTSFTQYEIWDDENNVVHTTRKIDLYPEYFEIRFNGSTFHSFNGSRFTTKAYKIRNDVEDPPVHTNTLDIPEACIGKEISAVGYLFDQYESVEYTDGLVRWYLRQKSPFNDGRAWWGSGLKFYDENCNFISNAPTGGVSVSPPYSRYYSVRFNSPTQYEIWNDETETNLRTRDITELVPSNTAFVSFWAQIDSNASRIDTTPFPISESDYLSGENSNVAFLPGLKASRLYIDEGNSENRLWEPNTDMDGRGLFMTEQGESINDVYTADVIDEGFGFTTDIYKSFIKEMGELVDEKIIAEWRPLPYDWRYNVSDVVEQDISLPNGESYRMVEEIEELAASSDSGKVTLVAHSNGGLVAKALINELEAQDKAKLVDKLILVTVPQLGTPKTITSLLHGYDEGVGPIDIFLTEQTVRELGENMPGGYGLLPSDRYFDKVSDPVIVFDEDTSTTNVLRALYGNEIDNLNTLDDFLLATRDDREEPEEDDLLTPNVLNELLLNQARDGQTILDNWHAPQGIEMIQIVGWGLDTIKGVRYLDKENNGQLIMDHEPLLTTEGDRTVVYPSAEYLDIADTYYLNLDEYGNKNHATIFEAGPVLDLLNLFITNEEINQLPQFIYDDKPDPDDAKDRLRIRLHSPVAISITDSDGNFTGLVDDSDLIEIAEEISNSYYIEFGEGKYLGMPVGYNYQIDLQGEGAGVFTLEIDYVEADEVTNTDSFIQLPVTDELQAILNIDDGGEVSGLEMDVNGDLITDVTVGSGEEFSVNDYISVLRAMIETADLKKGTKQSLLVRLDNAEKNLDNGNSADALLHGMIQTLPNEDSDELVEVIGILRTIIGS